MSTTQDSTAGAASSALHTPGPWMIFANGDIGSAAVRTLEHTVAKSGSIKGATIGVAMSNASLIAAAPDLLAALRAVVADSDAFDDESSLFCVRPATIGIARAAIAKATGAA